MSTAALIKLCDLAAIPVGMPLRVQLPGYDAMAICQVEGRYHAVDDTCTHGLASLSEGEIEDGKIICPFHGGSFDIATGEPADRPCTIPLQTYTVVVQDGALFLDTGAG